MLLSPVKIKQIPTLQSAHPFYVLRADYSVQQSAIHHGGISHTTGQDLLIRLQGVLLPGLPF